MKVIKKPNSTFPVFADYEAMEKAGYDVPDSWSVRFAYQRSSQMRWQTFQDENGQCIFPKIRQTARDFVERGFVYEGRGDFVKCTHCLAVLGLWEPTDNIDACHASVSVQCPGRRRRAEADATSPMEVGGGGKGESSGMSHRG